MTYHNPNQNPAPQRGGATPNQSDKPAGFSIGGLLLIVGGVIAIGSHFLTWYVFGRDSSITVNGLGQINSDDYEITRGRIHWLLLGAGVLGIVVGIVRLLGYISAKWTPATIGAMVTSVLGSAVVLFMVPKQLELAPGIFVAIAGAVLVLIGAVLTKFTRL